ncbi:MAG: competence/damage-inducible protein A [Christensenellales bacterium]|jgi:nicotinamide-nucleotide amidase
MKAELISVGTELLLGQTLNTNVQYLSRQLSYMGIDVFFHVTVGDNIKRLLHSISEALSRSDIVILTGGLGPTADDITKEAVAEHFGLPMKEDPGSLEHLTAYFKRSGREMTPNNLKQAFFPEGSIIMPNRKGTAPGCIVERGGKCAIILPGPPFEMEDMFQSCVVPYLKANSAEGIHSRVLRLFGIGESTCEYRLRDLMESSNPTVAPYAGFGEVTLRLTVKCENGENPAKWLDPLEAEIRNRLGEYIYALGEEKMAEVVARMIVESGRTIAVAESLTGGELCSRLVDFPGISAAFLEGCVAYSNEAKVRNLNVKKETLSRHGAVSGETAIEMAQGIRASSGADIAVSTTGIAGPSGATQTKPVGLVYIGYCDENGSDFIELRLSGDRERVRNMTVLNALNLIRRKLLNEK